MLGSSSFIRINVEEEHRERDPTEEKPKDESGEKKDHEMRQHTRAPDFNLHHQKRTRSHWTKPNNNREQREKRRRKQREQGKRRGSSIYNDDK